jgi:hypothetical protein
MRVQIADVQTPQPMASTRRLHILRGYHIRATAQRPGGLEDAVERLRVCRKSRYRGLAKYMHRLQVTAALTNLYIVRRQLLRT